MEILSLQNRLYDGKKNTFSPFFEDFWSFPLYRFTVVSFTGLREVYKTPISSEREQFIDSLFVNWASRPEFFQLKASFL